MLNHYTYEYDANGNILKENDLSSIDTINTISNTNQSKSQPLQAFTKMTYGKGNQIETYNEKEVKYDTDGNMINGPLKGSFVDYKYDKYNRLIKANDTTYTYDGENTRIGQETKGLKTTYITDPNASISRLLSSKNPDGTTTIYVYGLGLISQETKEVKSYSLFHYDYRGSTTVLTDIKGEVTDIFAYEPYGAVIGHSGNTKTIFLYVGREGIQFDDNGLYYMRGRYYNTDIHRFINLDPVSDGLNWYAYVNGNPVMYIDPSGYVWKWVEDIYNVAEDVGNTIIKVTEAISDITNEILTPIVNFGAGVISGIGESTTLGATNIMYPEVNDKSFIIGKATGNFGVAVFGFIGTLLNGAGGAGVMSATGGFGFPAGMALEANAVVYGALTGSAVSHFASNINRIVNNNSDSGGGDSGNIKNVYDSIKKSPNYPEGFQGVKNGVKKVNINNGSLLDELRNIASGEWKKVYQNGYVNGQEVSIHYFQHSKTGKVFNVKVKSQWSTGWN